MNLEKIQFIINNMEIYKNMEDYVYEFLYINNKVTATLNSDGDVWFDGEEISKILGKNQNNNIKKHLDNYEKKMIIVTKNEIEEFQYKILESGLYVLIEKSKLTNKTQFKKWMSRTVVIDIRKNKEIANASNKYEKDLQNSIIAYIREKYPEFSKTIIPSLGENQDTIKKRIDSYRQGYNCGQPDLILQFRTLKYIGLAIELKNPNGKGVISDKQREWKIELENKGWLFHFLNDYTETIKIIDNYMAEVKLTCQLCGNGFMDLNRLNIHKTNIHKN